MGRLGWGGGVSKTAVQVGSSEGPASRLGVRTLSLIWEAAGTMSKEGGRC